MAAAEQVLRSWTASATTSTAGPDLGPAVLATLVADRQVECAAVRAWLAGGTRCANTVALHGGLGTVLAGLRLLADRHPGVRAAAERTATALAAADPGWRTEAVGFVDYDLIGGPAGLLLAQRIGQLPVPADRIAPVVAQLSALAAHPDLVGLRIGNHDAHPLVGWSQDEIVTGLAHGVAGPLAALATMPDPPVPAVVNLARWLLARWSTDALGVVSWPRQGRAPGQLDGTVVRRQGWCYGTPGVSWALWTAGQALDRAGLPEGKSLSDNAVVAMASLCTAYNPGVHLGGEPLGVCHGAAGVLLVADAFARHAGLAEAAVLRDRLAELLLNRLPEVIRLGPSLLAGAPGVLAALLTVAGADRTWLRCLALY